MTNPPLIRDGSVRLCSSHPAVTRMTRRRAHRHVLLARPRDVVRRETGKLHHFLERLWDERLEGLWHGAVDAARRRAGARQAILARGSEAENLPLDRRGELWIAPLSPHLVGDLKAPQRLDLPLRRAIPDGVRSEHDSIRPA